MTKFNFAHILDTIDTSYVVKDHTIRLYTSKEAYKTVDAGCDEMTAMKLFQLIGSLDDVQALSDAIVRSELWCNDTLIAVR